MHLLEDAGRAVGGVQVEVGHAAAEEWVALAEVVVDVESRLQRSEVHPRLLHHRHLRDGVAQGFGARVDAENRVQGHRVPKGPGGDRVTLRLVGVEEARRARCP